MPFVTHLASPPPSALQLEQNLYNGGAAALSDLVQAQAQLETAKTQAADVHDTLQSLGIEKAAVIGHSMGGKAAMAIRCWQP